MVIVSHSHNNILELNEQCTKSGECFVSEEPEKVECRNGVCQCQFDYKANHEQNRCLPRRDVKSKFSHTILLNKKSKNKKLNNEQKL